MGNKESKAVLTEAQKKEFMEKAYEVFKSQGNTSAQGLMNFLKEKKLLDDTSEKAAKEMLAGVKEKNLNFSKFTEIFTNVVKDKVDMANLTQKGAAALFGAIGGAAATSAVAGTSAPASSPVATTTPVSPPGSSPVATSSPVSPPGSSPATSSEPPVKELNEVEQPPRHHEPEPETHYAKEEVEERKEDEGEEDEEIKEDEEEDDEEGKEDEEDEHKHS